MTSWATVTETFDGRGIVSYTYYDADGQVTETVDVYGFATFSYYDGDGNVTKTIDRNKQASYMRTTRTTSS
jgi:YD repeat-containing protein